MVNFVKSLTNRQIQTNLEIYFVLRQLKKWKYLIKGVKNDKLC